MPWLRRNPGYGRVLPTHRWQGRSRWAAFLSALKWWLGAAVLALLAWYFLADSRIGPRTLPVGSGEQVSGKFVRCGQRGSANCVPDGDTLVIGQRRIRIIGIDAPELHPARCEQEFRHGEAAAQALLALVNEGPFVLADPDVPARDEYGRELKHLLRARPDGTVQSIADDLVAAGAVRPYLRGARVSWC